MHVFGKYSSGVGEVKWLNATREQTPPPHYPLTGNHGQHAIGLKTAVIAKHHTKRTPFPFSHEKSAHRKLAVFANTKKAGRLTPGLYQPIKFTPTPAEGTASHYSTSTRSGTWIRKRPSSSHTPSTSTTSFPSVTSKLTWPPSSSKSSIAWMMISNRFCNPIDFFLLICLYPPCGIAAGIVAGCANIAVTGPCYSGYQCVPHKNCTVARWHLASASANTALPSHPSTAPP